MVNINKATATQYQFVLSRIPGPSGSSNTALDEVKLNIFNLTLPGISLNQSEMPWQGKHIELHLGGLTYDPISINFLVDTGFRNWRILYSWLTYVNDNISQPSRDANNYVTDATIILLDNFNTIVGKVNFKNMWIQQLNEMSFSIRDGESYIESGATFYYDRYEII